MKRIRKHIVWGVCLAILNIAGLQGQPNVRYRYQKYNQNIFNWGLKLGLNAASITHFDVLKEEEVVNNQSYYNKSGYSFTAFIRINFDRFLIQPELGWSVHNKALLFTLPSEYPDPPLTELLMQMQTADMNALIGYNITRTGPFVFNVITGAAFRYKFNTQYNFLPDEKYWNKDPAYNLYGIVGFSTNISAVHFDIRYEISIFNTDLSFDKMAGKPDFMQGVIFHKNENILSFSCGIMF